ncbi:SubName: Full=Uncharacterized protein {ECO:0000313/EMBL:CCA72189.1} [Serendipita indica DSM 11827]|nr:SubName: Full=Uncharacterized protein {ECO:0000313/EMBL:CCA72189.1} [Serendipita indica DSM 11827]
MASESKKKVCVVGFGEHGVDIESSQYGDEKAWRPKRVFQTVQEAADIDYDYIIACFKTLPDLEPTPAVLGIERDLQEAIPQATIISGCAWIDVTLVDNYRIMRHGGINRLVTGVHPPLPSTGDAQGNLRLRGDAALRQLEELWKKGGFEPTITSNIVAERWRKNLWNAAFSTLATLARADLFQIYAKDAWEINRPVAEGLMNEVVTVARAIGITEELLPSSAVKHTVEFAQAAYSDPTKGKPFKPSMTVDLEAGRPMEVEGIVGSVVKQAKELSIAVPRLETAYAALKLLQRGIIEKRSNSAR